MKSYKELVVWQKAMDLVVSIYQVTKDFPKSETYGLSSQIQRAAVSIPSNIAEGFGLQQTKPYLRHLAIACGSLAELETQLEIATRLAYVKELDRKVLGQANEVGRLLTALRKSLQAKLNSD